MFRKILNYIFRSQKVYFGYSEKTPEGNFSRGIHFVRPIEEFRFYGSFVGENGRKELVDKMEEQALLGDEGHTYYVKGVVNGEFDEGNIFSTLPIKGVWSSKGKRNTEEGRKALSGRLNSLAGVGENTGDSPTGDT